MRCPFCAANETKVVDSRLAGEGDQIRRRRECISCHERFTTFESAELVLPRIIKRSGNRVAFDEECLRRGIMRALEKRPVPVENIEDAMFRIKHRLQTIGEREVQSHLLGEWVMEELKVLDHVAYVRFASVYRRFEDLDAFRAEIDRLKETS